MAGARRNKNRIWLVLALAVGALIGFSMLLVRPAQVSVSTEVWPDSKPTSALINELESRDHLAASAGMDERTVRVKLGEEGYEKPIPALIGGFDSEADVTGAANTLVRRMLSESEVLSRDGGHFGQIIKVRPADQSAQLDIELAQRVATLLRGHGLPASHSSGGAMPSLWIEVNDRELGDFGRVLSARENFGGAWSVIIDPELRLAPSYQRRRTNELRITFKSDRQNNAIYARDDAFDILERRLRQRIWELARDRYDIEEPASERFDQILQSRYPGLLLADLGRKEFTLVRKELVDGGDVSQSYQVDVSWVGDRHMLQAAAETTLQLMRAEAREPYVRFGLGVGAVILCILGWLKVDWLLKGRHSFLSKVAFAILALLAVALSMNMPIHA